MELTQDGVGRPLKVSGDDGVSCGDRCQHATMAALQSCFYEPVAESKNKKGELNDYIVQMHGERQTPTSADAGHED